MTEVKKYDLQVLESEYRLLTTNNDLSALEKMRSILAAIRYDLSMDAEVIMEYRDGMDTPIIMRILKTEKDLDRWVEQRFIRLMEY